MIIITMLFAFVTQMTSQKVNIKRIFKNNDLKEGIEINHCNKKYGNKTANCLKVITGLAQLGTILMSV